MKLIDLQEKFNQIKTSAEQVKFADIRLSEKFKSEYTEYINNTSANGYSKVEWAEFSTKIITSSGKSIFLPNYWFYIASELANYLEGLTLQKKLFVEIFKNDNLQEVATSLRGGINTENKNKIEHFFNTNGYSSQEYDYFVKFVSDYKSWGGGKTIDRNDYYVSPLLQAGNLLAETQSAVAEIAKQFSEEPALKNSFHPTFVSSCVSVDNSNCILTESSRGQFVYNLVSYLIVENNYNKLFHYLVEKNTEHGSYNLEYQEYRLTSIFKVSENVLTEEELTSGEKLRFFLEPFIINSKYYYLSKEWTDGKASRLDIQAFVAVFNALYEEYIIQVERGQYTLKILKNSSENYHKLPKPFLLLAGISGTGKTRFVREQADEDNYEIVPVRPDWHEPSDLLGYVTRLTENEKYVVTDVLIFMVKAWRAILEAGLTFEGSKVSGDITDVQKIRPFWLCLDEMNLAPVEQYFADYLSISETQEWEHEDGILTYSCDALLSSGLIKSVDKDKLRDDLKLSGDDSEQLWQHFTEHGISIPFNLIVAGTVNMDETTHGFSRKVIDRALSFDFGEFYPNNFQKFFVTDIENHKLTFPVWTDGRNLNALSQTFDGDGKKSIDFLETINQVLDDTPFKLAYRALNEILLSVITNKPQTMNELCAVWDDFIMCKLLPRIEGDLDKLSSRKENDSLLMDLLEVLEKEFEFIWEGERRPDLYRKYIEEKEHPKDVPSESSHSAIIWIPCRSKEKLIWMQGRLERDTFTSFWP